MHFNYILRDAREQANLTDIDLSKKSGIPLEEIHDYEFYNRSIPYENAVKLAKALSIPIEKLHSHQRPDWLDRLHIALQWAVVIFLLLVGAVWLYYDNKEDLFALPAFWIFLSLIILGLCNTLRWIIWGTLDKN